MSSAPARLPADGYAPVPAVPLSLRVPSVVVCTFCIAVPLTFFCTLGFFALSEPDEPRYAEIAREMIELGDWVTPHLNYVKYFEKPPLVYWLTAASFELLGMSDFVARLWPAVFGLVGIGMAYVLGRSMYGPWTGSVAAALLAATPFSFGLSQFVTLDMPLSGLMAVALGAFWFAYTDRRRRLWFVLLLYAATAFAVLTKGPVAALLTGGILMGFLVVHRNLGALRWLLSPVAIAVFLVIALPWFVLVSQRNPEFVEFFFVKQHLSRFLQPDEHRQPLWYFVPILLVGMLPWTAFVLFAPRRVAQFTARCVRLRVSTGGLYCVVWSAVVFAFFSLSGSKLATYILPMFCPLAILAARFFEQTMSGGRADVLRAGYVALLVLAIGALVGAAVTGEVLDDWRTGMIVSRVYLGAPVLGVAASVALALLRRRALQGSLAALLLGMLVLQVIAISGRVVGAQYEPLGRAIRAHARPDDQIIQYAHYVQGIPFYGRRRTVLVGAWGELDFGSRQGDQSAFFWKSDAQLLDAWRARERRMFLVINRVELEPLLPHMDPPPRQIAAHWKKVVVVNFD